MKQITDERLAHIKEHMIEIQRQELLDTRFNRIEKVGEWANLLSCIKELTSLEGTVSLEELREVINDIQAIEARRSTPF